LIPFLFKEFEGVEARYLNRHVKSCKITTDSNIGFTFNLLLEKADYPIKPDKYNMFISITRLGNKKVYQAKMYKTENGKTSFLKISPDHAADFNEYLEGLFRISFVNYVKGAVDQNDSKGVVYAAIKRFMTLYELDEYDFTVGRLSQYYYRSRNKKHLSKMQKPKKYFRKLKTIEG